MSRFAALTVDAVRRELLREDNAAAERFYGMGFTLGQFTVDTDAGLDYMSVVGEFVCICGRREVLQSHISIDAWWFGRVRPSFYEMLENTGAMSRAHLLQDGYSEAEVDAMEARYLDVLQERGTIALTEGSAACATSA